MGNSRTNIGGQAVMEGVMMRGSKGLALCVRSPDGDILLDTKTVKPSKKGFRSLPVVRGAVNLISSMVSGVSALTKSAEVFSEDDGEELTGGAVTLAVVLGILFSVGLFIILPSLISSGLESLFGSPGILVSSLIEGGIRIVIFITYLLLVSLLKDIRRTFMYHGAEHKTINCYEKGLELTTENVMASSKVHNRCGTTFLFFVITLSILVFALTNWLTVSVGLPLTWWTKIILRIIFLPLVAGLSYELLKFLAKLPDNAFTKILRAPGLALQAITTKEPDSSMAEVAIAAFKAVLEIDENQSGDITLKSFDTVAYANAKNRVTEILQKVNAESAETDWILCEATGKERKELGGLQDIKRTEYNKAISLAKKRAEKQLPLAYVLKHANFYGYELKVSRAVLIPRSETELLAEKVIEEVANRMNGGQETVSVLDMCTGSGCIAMAVASESQAKVTACDISPQSLEIAKYNTRGLNVTLKTGDMFEALADDETKFDVIVSNPPYVCTGELKDLQAEVKKEPHLALDGGADGLRFYRTIAGEAKKHLVKGGKLLLEAGIGQAELITELLKDDFTTEIFQDYSGIDRIVSAVLIA